MKYLLKWIVMQVQLKNYVIILPLKYQASDLCHPTETRFGMVRFAYILFGIRKSILDSYLKSPSGLMKMNTA